MSKWIEYRDGGAELCEGYALVEIDGRLSHDAGRRTRIDGADLAALNRALDGYDPRTIMGDTEDAEMHEVCSRLLGTVDIQLVYGHDKITLVAWGEETYPQSRAMEAAQLAWLRENEGDPAFKAIFDAAL